MFELAQSKQIIFNFFKLSNLCSPQPIAAGIPSSAHLIAICELTPPYLVIRPEIF